MEEDLPDVASIPDLALDLGAEFCDCRVETWRSFSVQVRQSRTRNATASTGRGASVRALVNGAWGLASTVDVSKEAIIECCRHAVSLARHGSKLVNESARFRIDEGICFHEGVHVQGSVDAYDAVPPGDRVRLLLDGDALARGHNPLVKNVMSRYADGVSTALLVNSFGARVEKTGESIYAITSVLVDDAGNTQSGTDLFTHLGSWETMDKERFARGVIEATDQGVRLTTAKPCPPGSWTIVVDGKLGGVFVHEAIGHASEADALLAGQSLLEGRMGETIGANTVTIVDDGANPDLFGYSPCDTEGIRTGRTVLVDRGTVSGFLHDIETASRMGVVPTGNGRADGFDAIPQVRMTSTYLERGDWDVDELVAETRRGILCKNWQYGYVEPDKGTFMFKAKEGALIENGRITTPLKDVALAGQILEVLHGIDAIASDFSDSGGMCGKGGQHVRVADASPHFRIKNVLVGGMA